MSGLTGPLTRNIDTLSQLQGLLTQVTPSAAPAAIDQLDYELLAVSSLTHRMTNSIRQIPKLQARLAGTLWLLNQDLPQVSSVSSSVTTGTADLKTLSLTLRGGLMILVDASDASGALSDDEIDSLYSLVNLTAGFMLFSAMNVSAQEVRSPNNFMVQLRLVFEAYDFRLDFNVDQTATVDPKFLDQARSCASDVRFAALLHVGGSLTPGAVDSYAREIFLLTQQLDAAVDMIELWGNRQPAGVKHLKHTYAILMNSLNERLSAENP